MSSQVVDQAQIDDVDRDLRVVAFLQLRPDLVLERQLGVVENGIGSRDLLAQSVRIAFVDAVERSPVGHHRVAAAELLGDQHALALRDESWNSLGNLDGLAVAGGGHRLSREYIDCLLGGERKRGNRDGGVSVCLEGSATPI